jgi:hypothetical protein
VEEAGRDKDFDVGGLGDAGGEHEGKKSEQAKG